MRAPARRSVPAGDSPLGAELGEGNFSKVHRAVHGPTGCACAVKVIEKAKIDRMKIRHPNIHNEILMERRVLRRIGRGRGRHPGIVGFLGTFQDDKALYYAMQLCPGGSCGRGS